MPDDTAYFDESCDFLIDNIGVLPIKKIAEHLTSCEDCTEWLDMCFHNYLASGTSPLADNIEFPDGIASKEKLLEIWHLGISRKDEVLEHLWDSLNRKLATKKIRHLTEKIRERSMRCIRVSIDLCPAPFLENELRMLTESYQELREQLGHQEFAMYMAGKTEFDLDKYLEWWTKSVWGQRKPETFSAS